MSSNRCNSIMKCSLLICGGLTVGALAMHLLELNHSPTAPNGVRQPASLEKRWAPPGLGKHLAPVRVHAESLSIPESAETEVTLRAAVQAFRNLDEPIRFKWTLPEETLLVQGDLQDELPPLKEGEFHYLEITVKGFSKEKFQTITIEAFGERSDFGGSAVITSRPEDTMESIAVAMKKEVLRAEKAGETP